MATSFTSFGNEDDAAWGVPPSSKGNVDSIGSGDIIKDALKKEQVLKDLAAAQQDLRVMVTKTQSLQKEIDKIVSANETLQMYIDNLAVQMAKNR